MGALMLNDDTLAEHLYFLQNSCGAVPGPMDSFLVLRGKNYTYACSVTAKTEKKLPIF